MKDVAFEKAQNVGSIQYRLHPIDVGFDLRTQGMHVEVERSEYLTVSYPSKGGTRRVIEGRFDEVLARLRKLKFEFMVTEPSELAESCSVCGGEIQSLGTLGQRHIGRCRNCGLDSSIPG